MTFVTALRRHSQVILSLLAREEESRRKHPVDSILHMFEPIIIVGSMCLLWWLIGRTMRSHPPVGDSIVLFYATGFYPMYLFISISRRMARYVERPRDRFPIEQRLDHILVHLILRVTDYSIFGLIVFSGIYLFITDAGIPHDWSRVLDAALAIVLMGFGWGVVVMIFSRIHWTIRLVLPRFSRMLILLSGVFHIPDFMPPDIRAVMSWNPMLHAVTLFRQGFYYSYPSMLLDTHYLALCTALFVLGGLALERVSRRSEAP